MARRSYSPEDRRQSYSHKRDNSASPDRVRRKSERSRERGRDVSRTGRDGYNGPDRRHNRDRRREYSESLDGSDREQDRKRNRSRTRSRQRSVSADSSRDRKRSKKDKKESKKKRETSEERRARKAERKAEKKQLKEDLKAQKESQIAAQMSASLGYSNSENPFGDSNLSAKFVWLKKREKESKEGLMGSERIRRDLSRREEIETELDKLKKRRTEREIEQQLREQEQLRLQREQDRIAMGDWESKENEFHLEQAKTRAQIRIKEGRAKPIDIFAMNLSLASDSRVAEEFDALGFEMGIEEPYLIFRDLTLEEVEELHKDIQLYLSLETDENNVRFWEAMIVVCDDELAKHRSAAAGSVPSGVTDAIAEDIEKMFANKTHDQLTLLQKQIEKKLSQGGPVDVEYWETAIKALIVWKAKAKLRDMHGFMLRKRLERLREKKHTEMETGVTPQPIQFRREDPDATAASMAAEAEEEVETDEEMEEYDPSMSPVLVDRISKVDAGFEVVDEEVDLNQLMEARNLVLKSQLGVLGGLSAEKALALAGAGPSMEDLAEQAFMREAAENMGLDETAFNEEAIISASAATQDPYLWHDKYRPRKPRYFNRVHTGYEWNKYNQTHYDSDNPPPKVVQGYKFNIFYPDLIDKSKAPTYVREKDEGYPDTIILRFKAGPPYEDIAFRIVNREWEYSHKKGFRSSFDRGVLQLWFHFKRHYYRR
ncbi:uncharacterized protein SPPG_08529 [Spizellomyces punctatus DAOM BR117]|uniref:Splicing factor Cactin n=1 Tax=Spizellomyces punctatus (strain DAOM BR117) TaxID=645134 RepID=A0A0L0H5G5_SPIPD|nr:uncharacterized protein SPPG_08529 [Spizellomyces punctatus DAOM BR117]KNC96141.1 hypothetical protein SPPG_08529 [Spizellomyces punctatus DAOM BR117]|eukprot:XP_016604181.1 hypothetical protein SPPG_08529 [Spizellomyces punctatus DAOM BR117]